MTGMRRLIFAPALALMAAGCSPGSGEEPDPVTIVTLRPVPVRIAETLEFSAVLEAGIEAHLFPAGGTVLEIMAFEGDTVVAGQLLVRLSGDEAVETAVSAARAEYRSARAREERASMDFLRSLELFNAGALSESALQGAGAMAEAASAASRAARAAHLASRAASENGMMRAPFDGVVVSVRASEGSMARRDNPMVFLRGPGLRARLLVPERYLNMIPGNGAAIFVSPFLEGDTLRGTVTGPAVSVDPVTALVPVTVEFTGEEESLFRPGMTGRLVIETDFATDALVIPEGVLTLVGGTPSVPVATGDTVDFREVTTGIGTGGFIQITSGLEFGDGVVIRSSGPLEQGLRVTEEQGRNRF